MKRRILSILLLCSMVLTTLPATAFAEEEQDAPIAETPVCSCETACTEEGMNADCPVCGAEGASLEACGKAAEDEPEAEPEQQPEEQPEEEPEPTVQAPAPAVQNAERAGMPVTYAAGEVSNADELTDALADSSVDTIKLMANVDITSTLEIKRNVTLDLNGKVLRMTGSGSVIEVNNGKTLTLKDSNPSASHKFKADAAGLWVLDESGDQTVQGGVITGGKADSGGGVYVEGSFNMNGGNIVGCHANTNGGGVYVGGTFQMDGNAKIIGCSFNENNPAGSAGVCVGGTMTMTGGEISNCSVGLYIDGTLNANGGTVKSYVISTGTITSDQDPSGSTVFADEVRNADGGHIHYGKFKATVNNINNSTITGGVFYASVVNITSDNERIPTIEGGIFKGSVRNEPRCIINKGTFEGRVTNYGTINDGKFEGQVTNGADEDFIGTITGGTFKNPVTNEDGGVISGGIFEKGITGNAPSAAHFTVTFDPNDGTGEPETLYYLSGSKVAKPADPTRAGYAFTDWYNGDEKYDFDQLVTTDLTLTAHWRKTIPGKGTEAEPYQISSAEDLKVFRDIVNGENGQEKNTGACGVLTKDIDLSGEDWTPIGKRPESEENLDLPYKGTFNGNGHTIKGLTITSGDYAGLFGCIEDATIADVTLKDGSIRTTGKYAGGIVAYAYRGKITGCGNENDVTGGECVGGIAGAVNRNITIDRSYNTGTISGTSRDTWAVGGIVGNGIGAIFTLTVIDCYNTGAVHTGRAVGGLFGWGSCRFFSCYNTGSVTEGDDVGGIAGDRDCQAQGCYYLDISAQKAYGDGNLDAGRKTAEEFANGTVLELLKAGDYGDFGKRADYVKYDDPWDTECKYLPAAERTLPVLKWQKLSEHEHSWGDWTSNGDGTHTRTCKRDATHTETETCTGGEATCTAKAVCEVCGGAYGETDPDNHADGCYPEWTISKTQHQQKYTLCGQVIVAKEKHTFGDWKVTKKATTKRKGEKERICEVCEYRQFKTIPVKSSKDGDKSAEATKDAESGSPKTGDSSSVPLWTALLCVSACGVTGTVLTRKRKRTK